VAREKVGADGDILLERKAGARATSREGAEARIEVRATGEDLQLVAASERNRAKPIRDNGTSLRAAREKERAARKDVEDTRKEVHLAAKKVSDTNPEVRDTTKKVGDATTSGRDARTFLEDAGPEARDATTFIRDVGTRGRDTREKGRDTTKIFHAMWIRSRAIGTSFRVSRPCSVVSGSRVLVSAEISLVSRPEGPASPTFVAKRFPGVEVIRTKVSVMRSEGPVSRENAGQAGASFSVTRIGGRVSREVLPLARETLRKAAI
jgi:hypothetical protein